jgi:glycosyltransferase involved in cell wall biosynthesis
MSGGNRLKLYDPERLLDLDDGQALRPRCRLVYVAPVEWNSLWQRPQQLAFRLCHRFDLSYIDPVGMRSVRLRDARRILNRIRPQRGEQPPEKVLRPRYVPFVGAPGIDWLNRNWLLHQIRRVLGASDDPWVLWIGAPSLLAETLLAGTNPSLVVYDCMDRYAAFHQGAARRRIEQVETAIVERADLVFTTSVTLAGNLCDFNPHITLAPNGVDVSLFAVQDKPAAVPAWLDQLPRPLFGYHGTIGDWLDYSLLEQLAERHPNWSFAFLGPIQSHRAARFLGLDNVHHHDPVPHGELPAHVAQFDAGLIPFELNELTLSVHPIKALEYLALGLPLVSRPLPDLLSLAHVVQFADTVDEWSRELAVAASADAHAPDATAARRTAVLPQSWDQIAARIISRIDDALAGQEEQGTQAGQEQPSVSLTTAEAA